MCWLPLIKRKPKNRYVFFLTMMHLIGLTISEMVEEVIFYCTGTTQKQDITLKTTDSESIAAI